MPVCRTFDQCLVGNRCHENTIKETTARERDKVMEQRERRIGIEDVAHVLLDYMGAHGVT
jgi:hypothetical protein